MTSYLCKSPACDPYISDNGHLKHKKIWTKKYKFKILTKSGRFSHGMAQIFVKYFTPSDNDLVSIERASLVEYACQLWSLDLDLSLTVQKL